MPRPAVLVGSVASPPAGSSLRSEGCANQASDDAVLRSRAADTPYVIGIDLGGTGIKGTLYSSDAKIEARARKSTPQGQGTESIVHAILSTVDELAAKVPSRSQIAAVGLAVPGVVDEENGVALWSENLRWRDVPLRALVGRHIGIPVWLGHDVRAGGFAEFARGAAAGTRDAVFLPIGTGIGAALLLGGHAYSGGGLAGEIGHVDVGHREACRCGAHGCLEAIASAGAMVRRYNDRSIVTVAGAIEIVERAKAGDGVAQEIWNDAVDALALSLAWIASVLAPEAIVIGGGMSLAGSFLFEPLEARLLTRLTFQRRPRVVAAAHGDQAASVGAAMFACELGTTHSDAAGDV